MSQNKESLEDAIFLLQNIKNLLEKELGYGYEVTDELDVIIDSLQFDLDIVQNDLVIK